MHAEPLWIGRALLSLALLVLLGACDPPGDMPGADGIDDLLGWAVVGPVELPRILPGTRGRLHAILPADGAWRLALEGTIDGQDVAFDLEIETITNTTVHFRCPPSDVRAAPTGSFEGIVRLSGRDVSGRDWSGHASLSTEVYHGLTPTADAWPDHAFPATPLVLPLRGALGPGEGTTEWQWRGRFEPIGDAPLDVGPVTATARPSEVGPVFDFDPLWVGVRPGRIHGRARLVNRGPGWQRASDWSPLTMALLPPYISRLNLDAASRGQTIIAHGQGFVGAPGRTILRLEGVFSPDVGPPRAVRADRRLLVPARLDGQHLALTLRPRIGAGCRSDDLGGEPGRLDGWITPIITFDGVDVQGPATPITFDVLPTRQVVWLRYLPAFTDALRLFGLRAESGAIRRGIAERVRRIYAGINVDVRLERPDDFIDFTIIDIGGPDPNDASLFGLDNSAGLDDCNARLDDRLSGRNAETGQFGGVFVESFLQLSAADHPEHPLADPRFDAILDPVRRAARPGAQPADPDAVERAARMLTSLVGQTVAHELGHALGLSVEGGCGEFHNRPGPRQLMDCGADRPFAERAELSAESTPTFTAANRAYLEGILPLPSAPGGPSENIPE